MLTSEYADPMVQQNFRDPNTGAFDANKVKQYLDQLRTSKDTAQKNSFKQFEEGLINQRLSQKYSSLIGMSVYTPKAMAQQTIAQRGNTASIDYVMVPYTSVKDDEVKVTDEDCKTYMNKYATLFNVEQPLRSADYVAFDIIPSTADTQASLGSLNNLATTFAATDKMEEFIANNSMMMYDKKFYAKGRAATPGVDSANNSPVGTIVGPFYEDGMYKMTKVLAKKEVPDSVKASHILVAITKDVSEETAKTRVDSLFKALKSGANFEQLASTLSDDGGSKAKAGDLGYIYQGMMVTEFDEYCFTHSKGSMDTVKTQFGYHIIKITDQKDFKSSTQSATLAKAMVAGEATINKAYAKANNFASTIKDKASFEAAIKKQGVNKRVAENVRQGQNNIQGIGPSRELTRWMFEAKKSDVSSVMNLKDKYVVACLTEQVEKGMAPVSLVKKQLEGIIRNQKKTKTISEKYKGQDLTAIASKAGVTVATADTVSLEGAMQNEIANEQKVIGAAFNTSNVNKVSSGIGGAQGVYFVKVKNINKANTTPEPTAVEQERSMQQMQVMQNLGRNMSFLLKKRAEVVDTRFNLR
jgi:peptidyl-prolyl cis-trans isomerase D